MSAPCNLLAMPKKLTFDAPNQLRAIREAAGLSLDELSQRVAVQVSINQLSRMERGINQLTTYWLRHLADALECAPADLLLPDDGGLTARERELIETYRQVPDALRAGFDALKESHEPYRHAAREEGDAADNDAGDAADAGSERRKRA